MIKNFDKEKATQHLSQWLGILFSRKLQVDRELIKLMWKIEDNEELTLDELIFLKDQLDKLLSILRVYRGRNKELVAFIWELEKVIYLENEKC